MAGPVRKLRNLITGGDHTCPRWLCFTFDNPIRRLFQNPDRIVGSYVSPGDRVLDLGPGTGFLTLPLARLVGPDGEVVAADIQQAMLDAIARRAERHGLANIRPVLVSGDRLPPDVRFDFAVLFWMLHEVRDREAVLRDVRDRLTDGARLLVVEPIGHVSGRRFELEVAEAESAGLVVVDRPRVRLSRAALFRPGDGREPA